MHHADGRLRLVGDRPQIDDPLPRLAAPHRDADEHGQDALAEARPSRRAASSTSLRRFGSASGGSVASSRWYSAITGRPARADSVARISRDGGAERAVADDLVGVDRLR